MTTPRRPAQPRPQQRPVRPAGPVGRPAVRPAGQRPPVRRPAKKAPWVKDNGLVLGKLQNRLKYSFAAVCTLLLIIGGRLVQLQGIDAGGYAGAAKDQRIETVALHAKRGEIVDRFGNPMAYTTTAKDITTDPTQIKPEKHQEYAAKLAPLVGRSRADVLKALSAPGRYAVVARALPPATAQKVADLDLVGIYSEATTQRQYPNGTTGSNVVGFVHADGKGASGIEAQFDSILAGKDGRYTYAVDNRGNLNPAGPHDRKPALDGGRVQLTIDRDLQFVVDQYLEQAIRANGAVNGQVAVLDAKTGQVLALSSGVGFDPSNPKTITPESLKIPAVQDIFEPGSVHKVVTFAAALEMGKTTPGEIIEVPNEIKVSDRTIHDAWWHPTQNFTSTGVLAQSSNVGTITLAQRVKPNPWDEYQRKFGVGEKTGIELPAESPGLVLHLDDWSGSTFGNVPIGQGVGLTVLQLASMYQAIANDGVRVAPRITMSVTKPDGSGGTTPRPEGVRVITPQTAATLRTMLESVVLPGGTGVKANVPGYRVAGKTGTAQQPDPDTGEYSHTKLWSTFAGMVPAENPQFVIAVMINNRNGQHGGDVAAPLFKQVAAYQLQHARVAPSGATAKHVPLLQCDESMRNTTPDVC